jgi:hypothetical protein
MSNIKHRRKKNKEKKIVKGCYFAWGIVNTPITTKTTVASIGGRKFMHTSAATLDEKEDVSIDVPDPKRLTAL